MFSNVDISSGNNPPVECFNSSKTALQKQTKVELEKFHAKAQDIASKAVQAKQVSDKKRERLQKRIDDLVSNVKDSRCQVRASKMAMKSAENDFAKAIFQ